MLLTRRRWSGQQHIPAAGPAIVAANHISHLDPFPLARFLYQAGRVPRFFAEEKVFALPVAGRIVRGAGQIPVSRYSENAADALADAALALRRGECAEAVRRASTGRWPRRRSVRGWRRVPAC